MTPRILIGATGSIAVTALPLYLTELRATLGATITVLMTHTATLFLPPHTVAMHADRVISGESPTDWPTDKPSRLAAEHDLCVVLPATAHILAAAATGSAPNRLATVILSARRGTLFFPSMGAAMWEKPAVQRNITQLQADGHHLPPPEWHTTTDIHTGALSHHPTIPSPATVTKTISDLLD
ncbi:flavoprotein [Actinokineospora globicatena]|uniref:Phosphopantothenoylcysteine decarboxylase n=1 Tax=Actinokineospora globicatena TaxID=103729 RepID=A0A9W6QRH3_9PSEU|nr:flavoprotein [Actinokineospora globicatena]GLW80122.1 phosphopantothenoylcysteine decarboxylase [Actinokineospora globicatena]GLW86951.1 phosphopantothenoylcysteine decarboxylase [Actinokineospora globicatena]GLW93314.1 phosphopantothenoylcysteine decarboxylase [Actinokineospora globicatena]